MIDKFLKIKNVGKFHDCAMGSGSQYNLALNTFVFGRNTRGKSMLTAILESLKSNLPDLIIGRKTFGAVEDQEIEIQFLNAGGGTKLYEFKNGAWNQTNPNILIFDNKFIAKNVYSDDSIMPDHENAVLSVILGEQGKKLEDALNVAQKKCDDLVTRKREISMGFAQHLGVHGMKFEDFVKLAQESALEAKVKTNTDQIKAYNSAQQIQAKLTTFKKKVQDMGLDKWEVALAPTVASSQELVSKHILEHLKNPEDAKIFLAQGLEKMKDKQAGQDRYCVFCGQLLGSEAEVLLASYAELFSEQYKNLVDAVNVAVDVLDNWSLTEDVATLVGDLKSLGVELKLKTEVADVGKHFTDLKDEIENKKKDLEHKFDVDKLTAVINPIGGIMDKIRLTEKQYSAPDVKVLGGLNNEKSRLEMVKNRYNQPWTDFCGEYQQLKKDTKVLRKARDKTLDAKNQYAENILAKCEITINDILIYLGANFQLVDLKPKKGVRQTGRLFGIMFDERYQISLDNKNESIPNFKNALGESDKRMLAFAFFIAGIKTDTNRNKKILVMDDPTSSLDEERRWRTVSLLNDLMDEQSHPLQLFILTHDEKFLSMLCKQFSDKKTFKLECDMQEISIEIMNVLDESIGTHYKNLDDLEALRSAPASDLTTNALCPMRDVMEHIIKTKHYLKLKQEISSGSSISQFIKTLSDQDVYTSAIKKKSDRLLANFINHDDSTGLMLKSDLSDGDKRGILDNFFKLLNEL